MKPRVVFVPGIMGSVLIDKELGSVNKFQDAVNVCKDNLGHTELILDYLSKSGVSVAGANVKFKIKNRENLCDGQPAIIWGSTDMFHWRLNPAAWEKRFLSGDGYNQPGKTGVHTKAGNSGLFQIAVEGSILLSIEGIPVHTFDLGDDGILDPYLDFTGKLARIVDLRLFPYDWRLSNTYNANILAEFIKREWWSGRTPPQVKPEEKVTIIAHSMGGLLARFYIESAILDGSRFVRQLITVGTPHLGAPEAYTNYIGKSKALPSVTLLKLSIIPEDIQLKLMRHFASVPELWPIYDFVCFGRDRCQKGKYENHKITTGKGFGALRHKSGKTNKQIIDIFRSGLVAPENLDRFLSCHNIPYHLVAADEVKTIVGYNKKDEEVVESTEGDGSVPRISGTLFPYGREAHNIFIKHLIGSDLDGKSHQKLFQVHKVQDYCIEQIFDTTFSKRIKIQPYNYPRDLSIPDLSAIAKKIPGAQKRDVLSIIRISFSDNEKKPIFEYEIETKNGRRYVKGLKGVQSGIPLGEVDGLTYVYIIGNGRKANGGVLFLPGACQSYVDILTWNIGQLESNNCSNAHHAEIQFTNWFSEQKKDWEMREVQVDKIEITNRSTKKGETGVSPCNYCCSDLRAFLINLEKNFVAKINWIQPYKRKSDLSCGYSLQESCLDEMLKAGWILNGPKP